MVAFMYFFITWIERCVSFLSIEATGVAAGSDAAWALV